MERWLQAEFRSLISYSSFINFYFTESTGIVHSISTPLAANNVSIYHLSTYLTDHTLVEIEVFIERRNSGGVGTDGMEWWIVIESA